MKEAMRKPRKWRARSAGTMVCAALLACGGPTGVDRVPADATRVLFIGNSLTYANDLPGVVEALAAAAGEPLYVETVAAGGVSLEDHWNGGTARAAVARGGWDFVVLQQGPSALEESRVLLVEYARRFAGEIRAGGAVPALYGVWPSAQRAADFDRVSESYRIAAGEVDGRLLPAGETWRAAWARDPALPLYGPDAFHPSATGTYAAALAVYGALTARSPLGLPATLRLRSGARITVPPATAELLQRAAAEAIARETGP